MANQLNDHQISPTNYMTAFLRQRGWRLPNSTITIPNVIPEVEPKAAAVRSLACSPVWGAGTAAIRPHVSANCTMPNPENSID